MKSKLLKINYLRLIIWRSLVQAQAGPRRKQALIARNQAVNAFLFAFRYGWRLGGNVKT